MNPSVKRLRQTSIFESFGGAKRGKILDLMEPDAKNRSDLRDLLAGAAEKRLNTHDKSKEIPSVRFYGHNSEGCSSAVTSSLDDTISFSQNSDELFPELNQNSDSMKATSSTEVICDMQQLKRLPECSHSLPPLKSSESHTVMFRLPIRNGVCPEPYPSVYHDIWDVSHVRMPCSPENKCPVFKNGEKIIESRWELIEKSLLQDITSSYDLQEAILQYNSQYANRWDFRGIHDFFKKCLTQEETTEFFKTTLPAMVRLALQLPEICTQPIPLLKRQSSHAISFSQKQIACLLANAFFCTFPRRNLMRKRNEQNRDSEYASYPDINFNRLFASQSISIAPRKAAKLKCLINYFARVTSEESSGTVTFHRQCLNDLPEWSSSKEEIQNAVVSSKGVIEVEGHGMLQVDFANKLAGGGVLGYGSVQEEIRFVICPELILSRLFTERLGSTEVLFISGVEQYNQHSGYGDSFEWESDFRDQTPRDAWGRRCTKVVAMDALSYHKPVIQFRTDNIRRELNKAYCGFYELGVPAENLPAVATGNWGCGVFKGNPHLKFIIQLMAASKVGRDIFYLTFGNPKLEKELNNMYSLISSNEVNIGFLWNVLCSYSSVILQETDPPSMYDYFCNAFHEKRVNKKSYSEVSASSISEESALSISNADKSSDLNDDELTDIDNSINEPG